MENQAVKPPLTQTTTAETDVTAASVTDNGKERKIQLKGPLSEILRRALDIIYAKDSKYSENYAMESIEEEPIVFDSVIVAVLADSKDPDDLRLLTELSSAAKTEDKTISFIVLGDSEIKPTDAVELFKSVAGELNATEVTDLDSLLEDDPNVDTEGQYLTLKDQRVVVLGSGASVLLGAIHEVLSAPLDAGLKYHVEVDPATLTKVQAAKLITEIAAGRVAKILISSVESDNDLIKSITTFAQSKDIEVTYDK